jgi:Fe-S oxidoreductase
MIEDKKELEKVTNCALCANMCKYSCPTYLATGKETITPQKIARLILYKEKALLEDQQGFFDVMFQSAMCGACKVHCVYDNYDLRKFIQMGRSQAFKEGMLPDETRQRVETFEKFGNPHGERQLLQKGTGDLGYLVSCSAYNDQDLLKAMDMIITVSRKNVLQFGGADICCGAPLYYAGDMEGFKKVAVKMKGEIEKRKLRKVITDCPTCMKMMTELYPEVGVDLDVEFVHAAEFLNGLLEKGRIKVKRRNATATYHDPCILANDIGISTAPREILGALGLEIKEPIYSGKDTHCCGGLAGARIGDRNLSDKVKAMRIGELKETAADIYLSACPTCKAVLSDVGMKYIAELISEQIIDE